MSGTSIALIFISIMFFVCFAAGSTILNLFKIQKRQISSKMIIGFFSLISFLSIIVFVLELFITFLNLQIFTYFLWGSILVFALLPIIFVKYWFKSFRLNWTTLILVLLFVGYFLFFYFKLDIDLNKNGILGRLQAIETYMDDSRSGSGPRELRDIFGQIMLSPLVIFNMSNGGYNKANIGTYTEFIFMFNVFIRTLIFTSLTGMILENTIGKTFVAKLINSICISLALFGLVAITSDFNKSIGSTSTFVYLVLLITIMLAFYCINQNRYQMYTYLLGLLTIAAIGLDKNKVLVLLFFVYAILLILSFSFDNMLIKDHIKILFPVSLGSLMYSLTLMNIAWIVVSLVMLTISLALVIWVFSSHIMVKQMEFTLSKRSSIMMVVIPLIIIGIGSLMFLAVPDWNREIIIDKFGYLFKFKYFESIKDPLVLLPVLISITLFELVICFLWVSRRKKFKSVLNVILVDFVVIQYLMFYNPFSITFWKLVLDGNVILQYEIFDLFYFVLIFAALIWLMEVVENLIIKLLKVNINEDEEIKIIIYKNVLKRGEGKINEWKNKIKNKRIKTKDQRVES
ncbi:hypothetical protein [Spiroplasma endosymbiont of Othius punctulatus]|uniref:hypothetical protein n=1 Tax=Spiroplasma endosymbiont of Othius punctulatus TaxID=3066289 RepID=UPI0030D1A418